MDGLLYHIPVILGAAAVADGTNEPMWKGLVQSLVDEPHSLNSQLGSPPSEERRLFSGPATLIWLGGLLYDPFIIPGLVRPSMVEPSAEGGGEESLRAGVLALELEDSSRGVGCWGGRISASVAKSSEPCVLAFGPAREGRRGWQPLRRLHRDSR